MDKEKVLQTLQELPTETKVKAWVFNVEKDYYHMASYSVFRLGDKISIWKSNKKGKRTSEQPIFSVNGKNHLNCLEQFIETLKDSE